MRLLIGLILPTVTLTCMRTSATTTTGNRALAPQGARLGQRAPLSCTVSPFRLCLEGWICDSSSISILETRLNCEEGSAILVKDGNALVLATKSECNDKRWFINDKPFPREVEATCGSVVPRGKSLRGVATVAEDAQVQQQDHTTNNPVQEVDDWPARVKYVQEQVRENEQQRRRLVMNLEEFRKKGIMAREEIKRVNEEIAGHTTIHHELQKILTNLKNERREKKLIEHRLRTTSTTGLRVPLEADSLSSPHIPSYAELLALQGYEAMPQIYSTRPPNPFNDIKSIDNLPSLLTALKPYTSYRRCGRIVQSSSDCPDGRICSAFSHLGEHRITCPSGHVAVELPTGHLELMVSSLVCPDDDSEWTAESGQGQRGQRVGRDVTVTCIQECACTPLSASPVCPPSQRCSPASFLVDMDDQCMLYECGDGRTLFVRSRYGWQPASHLVCGPGGEYLIEGKDKVGSNPSVTCVVEGQSQYSSHLRRLTTSRKVYDH